VSAISRIVPVANDGAWPFIRRGTEATVPSVPGFVNWIVPPVKVVWHQAVGPGFLDQRLVGGMEGREVHRFGVLDHSTTSARLPSFFSTSIGKPKADAAGSMSVRLAVDPWKCASSPGSACGLDDPVPDQVGERGLPAARAELMASALAARVQGGGRIVRKEVAVGTVKRLGHVGDEPARGP